MQDLTLQDVKTNIEQFIKNMPGWLRAIRGGWCLGMPRGATADDIPKQLSRVVGIINSMTREERQDSKLINDDRCQRIACGAGVTDNEVRTFLQQFEEMRDLCLNSEIRPPTPSWWYGNRWNIG